MTTTSPHYHQGKRRYLVYVNGRCTHAAWATSATEARESMGTTSANIEARLAEFIYH
jgi:hypothetical protein